MRHVSQEKIYTKQNSYNSFRHLKVEIRIMLKTINFNSCDFDRIDFNQLNELLFRIHLFVPLEYELNIALNIQICYFY